MEDNIYKTKGSKFIDFLIGFFLIGGAYDLALKFFLKQTGYERVTVSLLVAAAAGLALAAFLYQKRRYLGIGLFSALAAHIVAVSPYLLMMVAQ